MENIMKKEIKYNPDGTISIKDTVQNTARALEYMIDGLERQDKRDRFEIDFNTFGSSSSYTMKICYGCAATCAIQEIAKKDFTPENIGGGYASTRAEALNFCKKELSKFESAINLARQGYFDYLLEFFKDKPYICRSNRDAGIFKYELDNGHWKENLHYYKDKVIELKKDNPNWK